MTSCYIRNCWGNPNKRAGEERTRNAEERTGRSVEKKARAEQHGHECRSPD